MGQECCSPGGWGLALGRGVTVRWGPRHAGKRTQSWAGRASRLARQRPLAGSRVDPPRGPARGAGIARGSGALRARGGAARAGRFVRAGVSSRPFGRLPNS